MIFCVKGAKKGTIPAQIKLRAAGASLRCQRAIKPFPCFDFKDIRCRFASKPLLTDPPLPSMFEKYFITILIYLCINIWLKPSLCSELDCFSFCLPKQSFLCSFVVYSAAKGSLWECLQIFNCQTFRNKKQVVNVIWRFI